MPAYAVAGNTIWIVPPSTLQLQRLVFNGTSGSVGVYRYLPGAVISGGSSPADAPLVDGSRSSGCTLVVGAGGFSSGTAAVFLGEFDVVRGDVDFSNMPITVTAGSGLWITGPISTNTTAYYSV